MEIVGGPHLPVGAGAADFQPIAALPQYIFTGTINSTVPVAQSNAWGASLVLVALVLLLNLVARLFARLSRGLEAR